jgi:LPPG:FO 2-phospho-L-lactate transferase
VTVLAGGVGAARFLRGLASLLDPSRLTVIVNTADDETFFGLHVSPDLDTVTYTLAGRAAPATGWGIAGDTFACLAALQRYYAQPWFRLGDADLATHLFRTEALRRGRSLSRVTTEICARHGLSVRILPMTDDRVRTMVDVGTRRPLPFQEYLVKRGARPPVRGIRFVGVGRARPARGVISAIRCAGTVIIPPSNPVVSIAPILRLRGVRAALRSTRARIVAVSPLVRGKPIKGPLDRMLRGLGHEASAVGVAGLYRGLADVFVLDRRDARLAPRIAALGMRPVLADAIMRRPAQARALAATVLRAVTGLPA